MTPDSSSHLAAIDARLGAIEVANATVAATQLQHTSLLTETRDQAKVTNGRISKLELWKARIQGAWFVMSLAGPVITGLIIKYA